MERNRLGEIDGRISVKKILLILLLPVLAFAQPPPQSTFPLSVKPDTHIVSPTDMTSGMLTDAMSAQSMKPWCRLVSNGAGNVTLSGSATIDGLSTTAGDVVLLTSQTSRVENGPWVVASGAWTRPAWYASGHTTQAFSNVGIYIRAGTTQFSGTWWRITTAGAITIDTTPTDWAITGRVHLSNGVTGTLLGANFPALTGPVTTTAGSLATSITNAAVSYANIQNIAGLSVFGRSANSSGVGGDITGTNGQYLQISGNVLSFTPFPSPTPYPSITPYPSATPYPSVTPFPSATPYPTPTPHIVTLTGDVTGAGTGIPADTFSATIANSAVTLAKMANVGTATVFYRKTAGTGAPEVQTLATLKTDLGLTGTNSGDQTITLTGDVTGFGTGSFAATIANSSVTLAKMANLAANSFIGNNTGSAAVPTALGITTGAVAFLGSNTSANLAAALTNETGTGVAVFNGAPTFTGLVSMQGNLQIGTGTTSPQPLFAVAPVSGPIAMTFKIPGAGDYAQLAYKNNSDAQRGFIGYIGPSFSNPLRQDHFEFGTAAGVPIHFRPGDGDGVGFSMDSNSVFHIANVATAGGSKLIAFPATSQPAAIPAGSPSCGQLYMDTAGSLKFVNPSGTPVQITPP